MKKLILVAGVMVATAAMSGCATEAVLPGDAKPAPQERVLKYQIPNEETSATLIVVRDKGYLGSGCFSGVYLNDVKSAVLDPGEKVIFHLTPGEWNVAVKGEGKLCISDAIPSGRDITLKSNQTKAVRLFADPSGNVDVKPLPLR